MDKNTPSYNLNVVVRETGIKPDTLRAWERRYGLPDPVRTEGGHRLYSSRDIDMIRWFLARQDEGMRISQAVKMWNDLSADGVDPLNPSRRSEDVQPVLEGLTDDSALVRLRESWVDACAQFDEFAAEQILAQAFARYPVELVVVEVLQKGLSQIGEAWYKGGMTVQQEHFASNLALRKLNALLSAAPAPTRKERILIACPPGEWHVFATLLATLILRYHGWDVTNLGANVPVEDLEATLGQVQPDLVIYVATQLNTANALLEVAQLMEDKGQSFAFGGRIFNELAQLPGKIPGFFLGKQLQQVAQAVQEIFSGQRSAHSTEPVSKEYLEVQGVFEQVIPELNAALMQEYVASDMSHGLLSMINEQMASQIRAGLSFGDLTLIGGEIDWARTLLMNHAMPQAAIDDYLKAYLELLSEKMGGEGDVILTWLKTQ
ncbi:MerR family transcriptional regulator [bacterium]|nr:MerR family transcriptional regulator [bacterium]